MISFAQAQMRPELSRLWQISFQDPPEYPELFLKRFFRPEDCLVDREDGELAAAAYLLPVWLAGDGRSYPAHYFFAAATAPRFRREGIMARLLERAAEEGAARGDRYSILLPSEDSLYGYYAKAGYREFFSVRKVRVSAGRLSEIAAQTGRTVEIAGETAVRLNRLRSRMLAGNEGSMLWNDGGFEAAAAVSEVYGDCFAAVETGGEPACALCHREDGTCEVLETIASEFSFPALAAEILRKIPAESYCFRLPVGSPVFPGEGPAERFGMIRPLGEGAPFRDSLRSPYLGLCMD